MNNYVTDLRETGRAMTAAVGGKGANLGELGRIEGIQVPEGFCVTTDAYREALAGNEILTGLLEALSRCGADERENIASLSAGVRAAISETMIPGLVSAAVSDQLEKYGRDTAFAVRSSATAEDLPDASFAGQQDTYLNIKGPGEVLEHIRRCWASLFTERSVIYRIRKGFDHRRVSLAVVVQRMVFPDASGIMFTADPVTSCRKVLSIDASFGLGEALVSGMVNPDVYKVREGRITERVTAIKKLAVHAVKEGGTETRAIAAEIQQQPVLNDMQILELERLGRRIEAHFGCPQDIEWCLAGGKLHIVQSRPITALYPVPRSAGEGNQVYVSVGHQQMMTDAMRPLGLSMWQMIALRPMYEAGSRLFVDIGPQLAAPATREILLNAMSEHDPLIGDALRKLAEREDR